MTAPPAARGELTRARAAILVLTVLAGLCAAALVVRQLASGGDATRPAPAHRTAPAPTGGGNAAVVVSGRVRLGGRLDVVLAASEIGGGKGVVTEPPEVGRRLVAGDAALSVDHRPVFVLPGTIAMHRDLRSGARGGDVAQLEGALVALGHPPGAVDGVFDGATETAVAAFYASRGSEPVRVARAPRDRLRALREEAAARDARRRAIDALLRARRGPTARDIDRARTDLRAARARLRSAQAGVRSAQARLADARRLARAAGAAAGETVAAANGEREQAAAEADVALKQKAVAQAAADLRGAVPEGDDLPADPRSAEGAVRAAVQALVRAQADLAGANATADGVRAATAAAVRNARDAAARLRQDVRAAREQRGQARSGVASARPELRLARLRVRALARPDSSRALQALTRAAEVQGRRADAAAALAARRAVVVPADEVVFLPDLPVRISDTRAARGRKVSGPVMRVTAAPLIVDSSLSGPEAKRVRPGDPVVVEQREAGVRTRGVVGQLDRVAGGRGVAPDRFYVSVILPTAPRSLAGASVQLRIAGGP